jgi:hypothetical protein
MAATVREAVRELLEQTMLTMDALLAASNEELTMPLVTCARARQGSLDAHHQCYRPREDSYRAGA